MQVFKGGFFFYFCNWKSYLSAVLKRKKKNQLLDGKMNLWSLFKQTLLNVSYLFSLFITAKDTEWALKSCLLETWLRVHYYYYCKPNVTLFLPIFTLMRYKSLLWIVLKFPNAFLEWIWPHIRQPEIRDHARYCLPKSGKSLLFHKYLKVLICRCSWGEKKSFLCFPLRKRF